MGSTRERLRLSSTPYRRGYMFLFGALAHAIGQHAKAWFKQDLGDWRPGNLTELMKFLRRQATPAEFQTAA